eukprot:4079319-Pleurochrysis_carterae.AAC.1
MYSPFPSVLPYGNEATNAAAALRDLELRLPCRGLQRQSTPLFATHNGEPYTHAKLDAWLKRLI